MFVAVHAIRVIKSVQHASKGHTENKIYEGKQTMDIAREQHITLYRVACSKNKMGEFDGGYYF